jgi:hypothetical protein
MTTDHFFASFDSDQPIRLRRIPQDFHTVWTHGFLQQNVLQDTTFENPPGLAVGKMIAACVSQFGNRDRADTTQPSPAQPNPTQPNPTFSESRLGVVFAATVLSSMPF